VLDLLDPAAQRAISFIASLKANEVPSEYYEVSERKHSEYRVYNQTQYLLSIMFKHSGNEDLSLKIRSKHLPGETDNDPGRKARTSNDRFCVLDGETTNFYLAEQKDALNYDEKALLALYWLQKGGPKGVQHATELWKQLRDRYDLSRGVLEMDKADRKKKLHSVYKTALMGILAKKMNDQEVLSSVRAALKSWQSPNGGWVTDRTPDLRPDGVANAETTALAILALSD